MFGGSNSSGSKSESDTKPEAKLDGKPPSPKGSPTNDSDLAAVAGTSPDGTGTVGSAPIRTNEQPASGEKRSGNGSPPGRNDTGSSTDKKRRSSGVSSKASSLLASAKNSLSFSQSGRGSDLSAQTPFQKLGKQDPALAVPQGQHNNSAGESAPTSRSTFRVGVWEDRNKKCRRTMEDTHAFLYNFLDTPATITDAAAKEKISQDGQEESAQETVESDNGYFAIFDGHAGTFAADWCGKKLHIILEDVIRKNPHVPIPELLDQTFTSADTQLEKLPLKNSGCTAAVAVLRWEDRVPSDRSVTGSQLLASAAATSAAKAGKADTSQADQDKDTSSTAPDATITAVPEAAHTRLKGVASRQRVLYTANVGDARIILCRGGKALRLSYDHKGGDENEGKRIANAGGLILNNRVNGVLAVTRALGDAYMKDLVTGHPYTTETVIQPDLDEFIIIACDGLWDVCSDQQAVDLVRNIQDASVASKQLVDHALSRFSTDNLSCMIVRLEKESAQNSHNGKDVSSESSEGGAAKVSEADKLVMSTKQKIAEGSTPAIGVSASNSGRGYENTVVEEGEFVPTTLDGTVEEEPSAISDSDSPETTPVSEPALQEAKARTTEA